MTFEYAPAPESRSVVDIQPSYGLFINGEFTAPIDGGSYQSRTHIRFTLIKRTHILWVLIMV